MLDGKLLDADALRDRGRILGPAEVDAHASGGTV